MQYLNLFDVVKLVDGVPYVTVVALYQTLMQLPYLSDAEFYSLTEEYTALGDAINEAYQAQPGRETDGAVQWASHEEPERM